MCFQKTWFFRDFPTLDGSRIYSTPREDLDGPLHKRKTKSEKKNFGLGKGGLPLRPKMSYDHLVISSTSLYRAEIFCQKRISLGSFISKNASPNGRVLKAVNQLK